MLFWNIVPEWSGKVLYMLEPRIPEKRDSMGLFSNKKKELNTKLHVHGKKVKINIGYDPSWKAIHALRDRLFFHKTESFFFQEVKGQKPDLQFFFACLLDATKDVLENNPDVITAEPFEINVDFAKLDKGALAAYVPKISTPFTAFLKVNLPAMESAMAQLLEHHKDVQQARDHLVGLLYSFMSHEMRHHAELDLAKIGKMRLKNLLRCDMTSVLGVFVVVNSVRQEAATQFETVMMMNGSAIQPKECKQLMETLRKMGNTDCSEIKSVLAHGQYYSVAVAMSYTITLNLLRRLGTQEEAAWCRQEAKRLNQSFSSGADRHGIHPIDFHTLQRAVRYISYLDMHGYMHEYEIACKNLGIANNNRLLTWSNYKRIIGTAYKTDTKEIEDEGFLNRMAKRATTKVLEWVLKKYS